jgi:hypothetical protein
MTPKPNDLVKLVYETTLDIEIKGTLTDKFKPLFDQMETWKVKADALVVTSVDQVAEMKQAREARLALKNIRVEADKTRKLLKEDSLKFANAVQSVYNMIEEKIKPIETHLQTQENFAETERLRKVTELTGIRQAEMAPYTKYVIHGVFSNLGELTEEEYHITFNGAKAQFDAVAKAEEDRIAKAEQDARDQAEAELHRLSQEQDSGPVINPVKIVSPPDENGVIHERYEVGVVGGTPYAKFPGTQEPPKHIGGMPFPKYSPSPAQGIHGYNPSGTPVKTDKEKILELAKTIDAIYMPVVTSDPANAILVSVNTLLTKVTTFIKQKAETL